MHTKNTPSIALVYDRVNTSHGGAERVLLALKELYPEAPLFTSLYDDQSAKWARRFDVRTSFLQKIPGIKKLHRQFLALMPLAFSRLDLSAYDIVISITSAEAKAITVHPDALHVCYLLTPPRYLWSHPYEYQTGVLKPFKILLTHQLRKWDYQVSQHPSAIIPISTLVYQRALKYYRKKILAPLLPTVTFHDTYQKDNTVVDTSMQNTPPYYLIISRLVSYKRIDLAIQACIHLKKRLIIIGNGPDIHRLRSIANQANTIEFISEVSDDVLLMYYRNARALLVPAEEDFGITVLEAQRTGTPVIAFYHVGALDTAVPNKTVLTFSDQTLTGLVQAINEFEENKWDRKYIVAHAQQYVKESFQKEFKDRIQKLWYSHTVGELVK